MCSIIFILQMAPPSLRETTTMVLMIKVRCLLFEQLDGIETKSLPYFSALGAKSHEKNLRKLHILLSKIKLYKSKLYDGLHDFNRWRGLMVRIVSETEHYMLLLETSFSEHCENFHEVTIGPNSVCPCWCLMVKDLHHEYGFLIKRLF